MHVDSLVASLLTTVHAVATRHGSVPASLVVRVPLGVHAEEVAERLVARLLARFGHLVEVFVTHGEGAAEIASIELLGRTEVATSDDR